MPFVKLNSKQINRLSEILGNLSLLFLASMSIPVFSGNKDVDIGIFIGGVLAFIGCSIESILLMGGDFGE